MHTLFTYFLDFLFPKRCLGCGSEGSFICNMCAPSIPRADRSPADYIYPLYSYRSPIIRRAIWYLKYRERTALAEELAGLLYAHILEELSEKMLFDNFTEPIIIPVPLSKKRFRQRGYNQAELIAKELMKLDTEKILTIETRALLKIKDTPSQVSIKNKSERLKNLKGSFIIKDGERVAGRNIILIDDVTTTGATIKEARRTLRSAGAKQVIAFTVGH